MGYSIERDSFRPPVSGAYLNARPAYVRDMFQNVPEMGVTAVVMQTCDRGSGFCEAPYWLCQSNLNLQAF
jgi:hypothetical protein